MLGGCGLHAVPACALPNFASRLASFAAALSAAVEKIIRFSWDCGVIFGVTLASEEEKEFAVCGRLIGGATVYDSSSGSFAPVGVSAAGGFDVFAASRVRCSRGPPIDDRNLLLRRASPAAGGGDGEDACRSLVDEGSGSGSGCGGGGCRGVG